MRFWFVHSSEISIREQLITQIVLGILSDELAPGERLPSTRELARRFHLHPNTVSGAYRQLHSDGWVESRRGSGVFVRHTRPKATTHHTPNSSASPLELIFANFLHSARSLKIPEPVVRGRLQRWLNAKPPDHFLFIEPDEHLRQIVVAEIRHAVTAPIRACAPDDQSLPHALVRALPLTLPSKAATVRQLLPVGAELITLQVRSVNSSLGEWLPAPSDALIGVASAWPQFLEVARTMLIAAGFHPDALLFRDASKPGWSDGLNHTTAVVCDTFIARQLPDGVRPIPFPLLTEATLEDLRRHHQAMASAG